MPSTGSKLISSNQSSFKPDDSCISQLSITHEFINSFDDSEQVRGVFFDIWKAFEKVLHNRLIFKLKQNGLSGNLLNVIINFRDSWKQRVVVNAKYSSWSNLKAGGTSGSILAPLFS